MQLFLSLQADTVNLPIAYRNIQHGLLYRALSTDPEFATQLHNEGHLTEDRSYKHFTFSPFRGNYIIQNKRIVFHQELSMEVRSIDRHFIEILAKAFTNGRLIQLGSQYTTIKQCSVSDRHMQSSQIDIQTLSPIVVYQTMTDGHTVFLSPEDDRFITSLVHNAQRKWRSLGNDDSSFSLTITPFPEQQYRKVPTTFKTTFITGWHGRFHLEGTPQVIDMLYQIGLGAKSSQGFGMFQVI